MTSTPAAQQQATVAPEQARVPRWLGSPLQLGVLSLAVLSGFCGLGYELLWTRLLAVSLGHEVFAVLAVLAAFFVGLALGALALGSRIKRSRCPVRWYAAAELVIALWAVVLSQALPWFNQRVLVLVGAEPSAGWHGFVSFSSSLLLLLPATAAMGITLPALERVFSQLRQRSASVAEVYSANTFGAVLGTLLTVPLLARYLGNASTLQLLSVGNLICAGCAAFWFDRQEGRFVQSRQEGELPTKSEASQILPESALRGSASAPARQLLPALFLTGLLGLGYEVVVVRVLSQVFQNTVYTFAGVVAIYLLGTALGAAAMRSGVVWSWVFGPGWQGVLTAYALLVATALACLTGTLLLWVSPEVHAWCGAVFGASMSGALLAEVLTAGVVLLLPTCLMGALFTKLAELALPGRGLGLPLALNTLGAAVAPLLFGLWVLPTLGAKWSLLLVSGGYLVVPSLLMQKPLWFLQSDAPAFERRLVRVAAVVTLVACVVLPGLRFFRVPHGGRLLAHTQGVMASVSVVTGAGGERYLKVNDHFTMGSTASVFSDHRQTHLPLLLHGAAKSALYLGVGTGITVSAAEDYPELSVTAVELVPEVLNQVRYFNLKPETWTHPPKLVVADARRFILSDTTHYDVIIADLFHPSRDGAAALYTQEHFAAIHQHLSAGGLFCQWLPLYQLDESTLKIIVRTFLKEFPHGQAQLAHFSLRQPILALLGSDAPLRFAPGELEQRVTHRPLQRELVRVRLNSDFALFGGYLGSESALASFAGEGEVNTDDHPIVSYSSPVVVYAAEAPVSQHLVQLVSTLGDRREPIVSPTPDNATFARRLDAYWRARDEFLRAGVGVRPDQDLEKFLAQTKDSLLKVVQISGDFFPAYAPLLAIARDLRADQPQLAYQLLSELEQANPARPEAARLKQRLFAGSQRPNGQGRSGPQLSLSNNREVP